MKQIDEYISYNKAMTVGQILSDYRAAINKKDAIRILAELNDVDKMSIKILLYSYGFAECDPNVGNKRKSKKHLKWDEREAMELKRLVKECVSWSDVGRRFPGRSISSLQSKASQMYLKLGGGKIVCAPSSRPHKYHKWTETELKRISELYIKGYKPAQIAVILDITLKQAQSVIHQCKRVGKYGLSNYSNKKGD